MTRCVFCDSYSVYEDKCDLDLTMVAVCWEFQEVQIRKWMPLPCPVLCLYLCGDPWLICSSLSLLPILSQPLHSVLLHTGMVLNRFFSVLSVFIPPSYDALWLPTPWPAPSCSALPPIRFPFIDGIPLSLPSLFLSAAAFFWSFPPLLVKERQRQRREEDRSCRLTRLDYPILFFVFFFFTFAFSSFIEHCGGLRYKMAEFGLKLRGRNFWQVCDTRLGDR